MGTLGSGSSLGQAQTLSNYPGFVHVTVDAIPDIIKGKKAFHLNEFDQYLRELSRRVKG
jgi:hypothetical protein